ncbi:MAG: GNAT family N-acetyltransferase [Candidatus Bathyarchaeota archaeon]|nr:MAG: GNAT family N-acetyltransferase [Candidatus Bathyarchaeota archaeon]
MEIREAVQGDVEDLKTFILNAWGEAGHGAFGWTGASDDTISQIATHDFLSKVIGRDGVRVFLALDGDEAVGFATNSRIDDGRVELSGIVVLESRTSRGVGSRLLELAVSTARRDGYSSMVVKTEGFNDRAIGFYLNKGFERGEIVEEEVEGTTVRLVTLSLSL